MKKKSIYVYNLIEKYIIVKFGLEIKINGSRRKVNDILRRSI